MAMSQEMLAATSNIQQNAQARVPVIPNNGNPQGANNMPAVPQQAAPANPYPWLAPSAAMGQMQSMLSAPLIPARTLQTASPILPVQPVQNPQNTLSNQMMAYRPVLPTRAG